ncbi:hypothetical protein CXB51_020120 [Gossypium anomalum]|uniref:DUF7745 domain-containing protein n=1 Tax=Gossypium anomalum TaxID=47600 RepID=A0A8J5YBC4_9ROSI|nr:hypothetical protein CXB51_020120 [Gossypium anomalum]
MENEFLNKVEENTTVCSWSEKLQSEKGDSLAEGYTSGLQNFTRIIVTHNELQELRDIWARWDKGTKQLFYQNYGNIPYLFDIKVDKQLFRAMAQLWNSVYSCFTFEEVDLVPTMEEYTTLLRCPKIQASKAYAKVFNGPTFVKKLISITGMSEPWVTARALRHVDEAVTDLFDHLKKGITLVPAILADTFRSLSKVNKVSYRVFFDSCSPLKEEAAMQRKDDISEEKWMEILQNLKEGDIEWRTFWMVPDEILYRCGKFDWVTLPEIWGATGYTPLLALRQYKSRQFIPTTYGLAQCEFSYKGDHYKKKVREVSDAWKQVCWMKSLTVGFVISPEYMGWFSRRVNDNVPRPKLQVAPSELEIIKQDFEKKSSKLGKKIEQLEEEKMCMRLDVEVQKSEAEQLRKRKKEVEENLETLMTDYKKLRLSMKTAGLGKTTEQWRQEVRKEKTKADQWEKKFQEVQARNEALEKSLSEGKDEQVELMARVAELERSLCLYRNRNFVMELKMRLSKIEEMKGKIEELEVALQSCDMKIEFLEACEEQWMGQLHHSQNQTLAVQADTLSVKFELEPDRGQELASLLRKIKTLSIRAKSYL